MAFDFDSVVADDSSEAFYNSHDDIKEYYAHEDSLKELPLPNGPLSELLKKLAAIQRLEQQRAASDPSYQPILQTSIVTARMVPAHERVVTTLKNWGISVNQVFFLGGIAKRRILEILRPHIFFDDQMLHLEGLDHIPAVHVPFGIANK